MKSLNGRAPYGMRTVHSMLPYPMMSGVTSFRLRSNPFSRKCTLNPTDERCNRYGYNAAQKGKWTHDYRSEATNEIGKHTSRSQDI